MKENEEGGKSVQFSDILLGVVTDLDYLKGTEPSGSGKDFSNWPGFDFTEFGDWVLREKFFAIPTMDRRVLPMRIVQTDPKRLTTNVAGEEIGISFVIAPVSIKHFPTIILGKDHLENEKVLWNKTEPAEWHKIPPEFQRLANESGAFKKNYITFDNEGSEWANFLANILEKRQVLPAHFGPPDELVRDRLGLDSRVTLTERDIRFAEMQITQEEIQGLDFADFTIL